MRLLNLDKPAIAQLSDLPAVAHPVPGKGVLPSRKYRKQVRNQLRRKRRHQRHEPIEEANPSQRLGDGGLVSQDRAIGRFDIGGQLFVKKDGIRQYFGRGKRP